MKILAIETSCDDTCVAVLEIQGEEARLRREGGRSGAVKLKVLSNIVSSQIKIHRKYGGVYPTLAKREHQKNLVPVLFQSLKRAGLLKKKSYKVTPLKTKKLEKILGREANLFRQLKDFLRKYRKPKIDIIAVTVGPGLEPCLWVGVNFARALAFFWDLPIIRVNHIEAHIFANFVGSNSKLKMQNARLKLKIKNLFPAICLVVSGGHTQLILMKNIGQYKILGETRDDAAGECFDKIARILGLEYPGGPAIEAEASRLQPGTRNQELGIRLPRPMIYQKNFDFSFSGLKTAVLYKVREKRGKTKDKRFVRAIATEAQQAIIDVLILKTIKAAKEYKAKSIILGGGVAANKELRKQFKFKIKNLESKINFLVPPKNFCTDNAVMAAIAGFIHWRKGEGKSWTEIKAEANLRIS